MNGALSGVKNATSFTNSNVTILTTLYYESFKSQKSVKGHLLTSVNFPYFILSKDFKSPGYRQLHNVNFFNGAVLTKCMKVKLIEKVTNDTVPEVINGNFHNIFSYLQRIRKKNITELTEGLVFQPIMKNE